MSEEITILSEETEEEIDLVNEATEEDIDLEAEEGEQEIDILPESHFVNLDYEFLINKPQINGVTLRGNKSVEDLGVTIMSNSDIDDLIHGRTS